MARIINKSLYKIWKPPFQSIILNLGYNLPYIQTMQKNQISMINGTTPNLIEHQSSISNKIFIDEEKMPFEDQSFDHIFVCHFLEYQDNYDVIINQLWRILKDDGILYLLIPTSLSSNSWYLKQPFHQCSGIHNNIISSKLQNNNFEIIKTLSLIHYPLIAVKFGLHFAWFCEKVGQKLSPMGSFLLLKIQKNLSIPILQKNIKKPINPTVTIKA